MVGEKQDNDFVSNPKNSSQYAWKRDKFQFIAESVCLILHPWFNFF